MTWKQNSNEIQNHHSNVAVRLKTYSHARVGLGDVHHRRIELLLLIKRIADDSSRQGDAQKGDSSGPHFGSLEGKLASGKSIVFVDFA
jgi:hypothetical protein